MSLGEFTLSRDHVLTFRVAAAFLGWSALSGQCYLTLSLSRANGLGVGNGLAVYFSYFTILTNLLVASALTWPRQLGTPGIVTGIAVSIGIVGIVYNLVLRQLWNPQGAQRIVDIILHDVMPVLFLVYWWLAVPPRSLQLREVPTWLGFPGAYLVYALLGGAFTGRYAYPFIDVVAIGYGRVAANASLVLLAFVLLGSVLVCVNRARAQGKISAATQTEL